MTEKQAAARENRARRRWVHYATMIDESTEVWERLVSCGKVCGFYSGLHKVLCWQRLYPGKGKK